MRYLLTEFRVAIVMIVAATCIPLLWAHEDSRRRLSLKQQAWVACAWHHRADQCDGLRPAELPPAWREMCELRHLPKECARFGGER